MKSKAEPWYASPQVIVSLRPQAGHESLRAAARRHGARLLALSPWKLVARDDAAARSALQAALAAPRVLFTSPAAVQYAAALTPLKRERGQLFMTVGSGSARALQAAGVDTVIAPQRMDSEGFLALAQVQSLAGSDFGLITAPEGRDLIAPILRQRGARVLRADVYARVAVDITEPTLRKLRELNVPACVVLSSGAALDALLAHLPAEARARLLQLPAVAASARLAAQANAAGFKHVRVAQGPRPAQLLQAAFAKP